MKTGLMDYDNLDDMLIFKHMQLMILYRNQTKFGIRKRINKSCLLHFTKMAERYDWFSQCQSYTYMHMFVYIPLQVAPSSSNTKPLLHPQVKLPLVFVHIWEQPPFSSLHSSISG